MSTHCYTITAKDVGRRWLRLDGRLVLIMRFMGQVMEQDVGKRIYCDRTEVYNVESNEQLATRLEKEGAA